MLPAAYVCHRVPGRLRIRVPAKRGDGAYFTRAAETLRALPGIIGVAASPVTAGILVTHTSGGVELGEYVRERGLFTLGAPAHARRALVAELSGAARETDAYLRNATDGYLDVPSLALLALLGMSAYQLRAGEMMAPGVTLLWYAMSLMLMYIPPRPLPEKVNGLS